MNVFPVPVFALEGFGGDVGIVKAVLPGNSKPWMIEQFHFPAARPCNGELPDELTEEMPKTAAGNV